MSAEPYIVSIWRDKERKGLICTGLRLTDEYILSVRHAFVDMDEKAKVYIGLIDGHGKEMPAQVVQRHPDRDVALLKLTLPIRLNCYPELDDDGRA